MNKKLINKYLNEFVHRKDGGSILVKYANPRDAEEGYEDWHEDDEVWNSNLPYLIIINDEYSHFRKALAEGKTIQYRNINIRGFEKWEDLKTLSFNPNFEHRIKPEEHKFKVGDWVRQGNFVTKVHRVESGYYYDKNNESISVEKAVKWDPKEGEWCWFWDEHYTTAILAKFENISDGLFVEHNGNIFEYCEPFIGELPTHLKD